MKAKKLFKTVISYDQFRIRAVIETVKNPKSYLVLVHGRAEWIEKYYDIRSRLKVADDCAIISWDHRGQGESEGQSYHVRSYNDFVKDAQSVLRELVPQNASFGIIAHSMGGLISLLGGMQRKLDPDYMILCSPLFLLPHRPLPRKVARPLADVLYRVGIGPVYTFRSKRKKRFHTNLQTHDVNRYKLLATSPQPSSPPTFGWVHATFDATDQILQEKLLKEIDFPVLVLSGSKEEVVADEGFSRWIAAALRVNPEARIMHGRIPQAKHELLNEIDRLQSQVLTHILRWSQTFNIKLPQFEITSVGHHVLKAIPEKKTSPIEKS